MKITDLVVKYSRAVEVRPEEKLVQTSEQKGVKRGK